jgi:hypothetical protein
MSQMSTANIDVVEDDYVELIQRCSELSAFQLFRLGISIDQLLADPKRIEQVRKLVRVGDEIDYFDPTKNRCVRAVVRQCKRTRVNVTDIEDGKRWSISYVSINVGGEDVSHAPADGPGLARSETAVGDIVGFLDKDNCECVGTIVKLNQKTVGIECEDGTKWRVSYQFLFRILDGDAQTRADGLPFLLPPAKPCSP